jgi:F-type H+-transporting ATPase subunit b
MPEFVRDPEFWVAVAWVIAVGLIWWKGAGIIGAMLDGRAARIRDELDEAKRLHEEAARMLAEYQGRQREALNEAKLIAERARAEAERIAVDATRELEESLRRREDLAHERIAQAEAAAISEVRTLAVEVAIAAARRIIVQTLDAGQGSRLIDASIAQLPPSLH